MGESDGGTPFALCPAHANGRTMVAWMNDDGMWFLITTGEDGKLTKRSAKDGHALEAQAERPPAEASASFACKAMAYDAGGKVIVTAQDNCVQVR